MVIVANDMLFVGDSRFFEDNFDAAYYLNYGDMATKTSTIMNCFDYYATGTEENVWWTNVTSVPEPTSGLLLLLGMAGLALKRKRA